VQPGVWLLDLHTRRRLLWQLATIQCAACRHLTARHSTLRPCTAHCAACCPLHLDTHPAVHNRPSACVWHPRLMARPSHLFATGARRSRLRGSSSMATACWIGIWRKLPNRQPHLQLQHSACAAVSFPDGEVRPASAVLAGIGPSRVPGILQCGKNSVRNRKQHQESKPASGIEMYGVFFCHGNALLVWQWLHQAGSFGAPAAFFGSSVDLQLCACGAHLTTLTSALTASCCCGVIMGNGLVIFPSPGVICRRPLNASTIL
jgi:hypothetical protein